MQESTRSELKHITVHLCFGCFVGKALTTQKQKTNAKATAAQCTENHNINKVLASNLATLCNIMISALSTICHTL